MRRMVVVAVFAFVAIPAHAAWAGSGPSYTATYTSTPPTIDGSLSESAWASATAYPLSFGSIPATVRFLRDDTNLYVGVTVDDPAPGPAPNLTAYFDNGNLAGTSPVNGDDAWIADWFGGGEDFTYSSTGSGGAGYYSDQTEGGTNDTTAAVSQDVSGGTVSFEFEHPLCTSGDTSHDVCITDLDQVVGVNFQYEPDTAPGVFYDAPGGFQSPSNWASLDVRPVSYSCGSTPTTLLDNWNGGTVANGGAPPTFSTNGAPYCLSTLETYHYNGGSGDPGPGTIGVQVLNGLGGATGTMLGPWSITPSAGTTANDNWTATTPSTPVVIDGTYKCFDSSYTAGTNTWSQNAQSNGDGFCRVIAYPASVATDYYVSTPAQLASAISAADSNGIPATVHLAAGHYDIGNTEMVNVNIFPSSGGPITLVGAGAANTILDGDGSGHDVVNVGGSAQTTIKNLTVENGSTGIFQTGSATAVLSGSVVRDNSSLGVDAGAGGLTITGSTISGNGSANPANFDDGGIYVGSPFTAVNTTIAGNAGNGIAVDYSGGSLENVTIAKNGTGIVVSAALSAVNTIVANNSFDCNGAQSMLTSLGHNLDSDRTCFAYDNAPGDLPGVNPQLGPLQDNGGPTPTMALAPGSPAVDAGDNANCPATDQRGVARPQPQTGTCDIGAFELVPTGPGPTSPTIQASLDQDNINLYGWPANDAVTVTVSGMPFFVTTDGSGNAFLGVQQTGHDIVPGDVITAFDAAGNSKSLTVADVAITTLDPTTGLVTGTTAATDGSSIQVNENEGWTFLGNASGTASGGSWSATLPVLPLTGTWGINAVIVDPSGNQTTYDVGEPIVSATLDHADVNTWNWPANEQLSIIVGGNTFDVTTGGGGTPGVGGANLDSQQVGDISPGSTIDVTGQFYGQTVTKTLNVVGIKIDSVDTTTSTVSGTAPADSAVELNGSGVPSNGPPLQTTADRNGDWSLTLPDPLTGQWQVLAQTPDGDGDLSAWQAQLPWIQASLTANTIQGHGWPANDPVTLTVGSTTENVTTDGNGDFLLGAPQQTVALQPGATIEAKDGTYDKQLTLVPMTFDTLDPATQVAAGTAPAGANVQVCLNDDSTGTFLGCQSVTANGDGGWSTTFPDGTIAMGVHGVASTDSGDSDGDQTQVEDTVAPAVSLDSTPPPTDTSDGSTFTFSSPTSGAQFQCQVDGAGFQPCSSPDTVYLANGSHEFQVEAGLNGTFGDPATFDWTTNVAAPPDDTLRVDVPPNAIDSLDTGLAFTTSSWQILQATCDTLYTVSAGSPSDIVPLSATGDPVVSNDGLTATITVQSGLEFANGDAVTAQSFADAINRLLSASLGSSAAYLADGITGATADGQTLTLTMSKPLGDLASRLTTPLFCPVPSGTPDTPVTSESGSGPYTIASSSPSAIVLDQNPNYGGTRSSSFAHIRFDLGVDPATAEQRVLAGTSDYIVGGPPPADIPAISDGHSSQLFQNPALTFWYVGMNESRPPFNNPVLRQAINYALDRNAIASAVSSFRPSTPTDHYLPPGTPGYEPTSFYPLSGDLAKAQSLAEQAGVSPSSPITATYYAGASQLARQVEPVVAADLQQIGIDIQPVFTSNIYNLLPDPSTPDDLFFAGWAMDYPDPSDIFDNIFQTGGNTNWEHYSSQTTDAAIASADAAPLATRFDQWATLDQSLATGDAPLASLFNATNTDLFSSRISCQQYNPISGMDIASLCLPSSSGSLSGSVVSSAQQADLTGLGGEDWALWGAGLPSTQYSLTPSDYKASGGRQISDLSIVNAGDVPPRGFGDDSTAPFVFNWSDGAPTAAAQGTLAGQTAPSVGTGFSFTVPADATERTLTIWTSSHYANGTLTAHLSDGSAPDYTQTVSAVAGEFTSNGENVPGVFTIDYAAAHPGQHLTVTWTEDTNNGCAGCDDVVLYAAALSLTNTVTSATASLATGSSVEMSGANVPISGIPLSAFEITPSGITPAPINGLPINGLPINGLPINGLPINGLPINGLPINGLPINGLPINGLPINGLPINGLPINGLPINGLPINGLELPGQSWEQLLAGTPLANQPLQDVTLQQVLALPNPPKLTLGDLELSDSALGQLTIGALVLGGTPINGLGLPADALASLEQWCESVATTSTDCSSLGTYSLFALGLAGAPINGLPINGLPINGLPINGLPINGLPINGLDLSASPINGLPINGLPINGLPINGLPAVALSDVVDCGLVDCTTATLGDAATAGAIVPGATYGQLLTLLLESQYADQITLGDVIGLLIQRVDVPWETLPPRLLSVFDKKRPTLPVSASFTLQGSGTPDADVKVVIPDGFDYDPGSATMSEDGGTPQSLADPTITGHTLDWLVKSVDPDHTYTIAFRLRSGTTVGPAQVTETVSSGGQSDTSTASFSVDDSYPSSGEIPTADNPAPTPIVPNEGVQMSALASPGAVDYYEIQMPAAGTRIQVHLTNLPADYDLALYSNQTTSVRTGATSAPPLQDGIVSDQQINLDGGSNGQLTPTALQDVPNPGIPIVQVSANRGLDDEDVGMVSPGGSGYVTIAVYGYNGAFSPQPYSLRVKTTPPPATETCPARTFPYAGTSSGGTTPDGLPDLSTLPANLNTIILVDEKRLGDTYGSSDEATALAKLHSLAGDLSLGVSGVVLPVETISGVQSLYDQWDSNPCNPDAANAVANAIANEVDAIVAARPSVQYVVFAGGDDQIPFFRLPDLSFIANESGFAGQFGPNEYQGSLAAGDLLSDDPYLDTNPVPASGQQLFPPNLAGGRLVETAQDIANAVTAFETAPTPGVLQSSTAFVSGYDFVADSATQIAKNLTASGVSTQTLIDDPTNPSPTPWSGADLLGAAFPGTGPADINSWDGHYDNYRLEAANGDILTTSDLPTGLSALHGGVFFTMGCHAGFQTTDAVVGSTVLDWPQYFSEHDTGFVGNTGFGLGDTDSIAFSEELMTDFSQHLGGSMTLGQALLQAKQQYYLSRVAFSNYDEKTLSEAELYGLPMYGVGTAPVSLMAAADPSVDPVSGTSQSTSPSQGPLSQFTTGVQSASFSATPSFTLQQGTDGDFYTNAGQVQAPNYRPLQPYVSLPASRSGLVAHGVVIDSLTSADHSTDANGNPWVPDNVRPILNSSAGEPPPTFTDESWPEKIPTLVSLGADQNVNLITGQFFTDSSSGAGIERLWTQIGGRVTYSNSTDFTPPEIDSIDAFLNDGVVSFTGSFSDPASTVAFAQVVYDDGTSTGHWIALPLQYDSTSGTWSGGAPFTGEHVQFFVEVCDAAGNCGYSSNKGRYFDAQPLPSGGSGSSLTLTPSRQPDTAPTWYTSGLDVTAASTASSVSVSVDGGPFTPASGPIALTGDGAHVVEARDSDGNTAEAVYLIDTTGPAITDSLSPAQPDGTNGWYVTKPTVTFACTDNLSGVASCSGSSTFGENAGTQTVTGHASDNAGNTSEDPVSGVKVDLTPPTTPAFTNIVANQIYPVNSLPAQSAIGCTSSDATSGLTPQGCVVTGYSSAIGQHTLIASATDNAGWTSKATLTYTVGFAAGMVLAPVTAPDAGQTSPLASDLQVFKIKSTIPIKFQFYLDSSRTTLMTTPPAGSTAVLTVGKYDGSIDSVIDASLVTAPADTGNLFRWTGATAYQYIYNMATSQLTAGTYDCQITLYAANGTTVLGQSLPQYFKLRS